MEDLIDLNWEETSNEPNNSAPTKSPWILKCEGMEAHLVDLQDRLERGDDVVAICQAVGELVTELNHLTYSIRMSDDLIDTEIISRLTRSAECLINRMKRKIQVMNRLKPVAVLVEDYHLEIMTNPAMKQPLKLNTVENNPIKSQSLMSQYLKEKLINMTKTATTMFSNLTDYYWQSPTQCHFKKMI